MLHNYNYYYLYMCAVCSMFLLPLPVDNIHTQLYIGKLSGYSYVSIAAVVYTSHITQCMSTHWLYVCVLLQKISRCERSSSLLFCINMCMSLRATMAERSSTIRAPNTPPITPIVLIILCRSCGGGGQGLSDCKKVINAGMISSKTWQYFYFNHNAILNLPDRMDHLTQCHIFYRILFH